MMDALHRWQTAQVHMEEAVNAFFDACVAIRETISPRLVSPHNQRIMEDIILQLNSRMHSNKATELKLSESCAVLKNIANMSITLVPIHALPSELLDKIFALVVLPPFTSAMYARSSLIAVSSVCTRWRQLITSTSRLWSHIDVIEQSMSEYSQNSSLSLIELFLQRACGTPLHIHVQKKGHGDVDFELTSVLDALQPHAAHFASLIFSADTDQHIVNLMLDLYCKHGIPGTLKTLVLLAPGCSRLLGYYFPWPVNMLQGLVNLHLSDTPRSLSPDLDELASMLSASPCLRTLRLRNFSVFYDSAIPGIHLPNLRLLEVAPTNNTGLELLLSALLPGTLELDVRLELPNSNERDFICAIESLFVRSNVTSLHLDKLQMEDEIANYLSCLPHLRSLFLDCRFSGGCSSLDALTIPTEQGKFVATCPTLRTLSITRDTIDRRSQTQLKRIVEAHTLSKVVLVHCDYEDGFYEGDDDSQMGSDNGDGGSEELFQWLGDRLDTTWNDWENRVLRDEKDWCIYL